MDFSSPDPLFKKQPILSPPSTPINFWPPGKIRQILYYKRSARTQSKHHYQARQPNLLILLLILAFMQLVTHAASTKHWPYKYLSYKVEDFITSQWSLQFACHRFTRLLVFKQSACQSATSTKSHLLRSGYRSTTANSRSRSPFFICWLEPTWQPAP